MLVGLSYIVISPLPILSMMFGIIWILKDDRPIILKLILLIIYSSLVFISWLALLSFYLHFIPIGSGNLLTWIMISLPWVTVGSCYLAFSPDRDHFSKLNKVGALILGSIAISVFVFTAILYSSTFYRAIGKPEGGGKYIIQDIQVKTDFLDKIVDLGLDVRKDGIIANAKVVHENEHSYYIEEIEEEIEIESGSQEHSKTPRTYVRGLF